MGLEESSLSPIAYYKWGIQYTNGKVFKDKGGKEKIIRALPSIYRRR